MLYNNLSDRVCQFVGTKISMASIKSAESTPQDKDRESSNVNQSLAIGGVVVSNTGSPSKPLMESNGMVENGGK